MPIRRARPECRFAVALGTQEAAAHVRVESQCRQVHQAQAALPAGRGKRGGGAMVHAVVGLAAALAQDADAVHDALAALQHFVPSLGYEHSFQSCVAVFERLRACPLPARGMPSADDDLASAGAQRRGHVASNEPGTAQHQHRGHWCETP